MGEGSLLLNAAVYLLAAVVFVPTAVRLGLGSVIGYLIAGCVIGPFVLGRFFDSIGRRRMIGFTYAASGVVLLVTGYFFREGLLTAQTHTLLWSGAFFFASSIHAISAADCVPSTCLDAPPPCTTVARV